MRTARTTIAVAHRTSDATGRSIAENWADTTLEANVAAAIGRGLRRLATI